MPVISLALLLLSVSLEHMEPPIRGLTMADVRNSYYEDRGGHPHEAVDILMPKGTPVVAAVSGPIQKLFLSKPGGKTIYQFDNPRMYCFYYAHLNGYAPGLREGMRVEAGDVIGYVGTTGNADQHTPHLHFAIFELGPEKSWWKGKALDPYPWLVLALGRK